MDKPSNLLLKLSQRLFETADDRAAFVDRLVDPKPVSPCILWCQTKPDPLPFEREDPLPWQPKFVDRLIVGQKPGQHPLHDKGAFYCLDFSSVFAVSTVQTIAPVNVALDMCASPGGKSVFATIAVRPQQLLSNEVIGKRIAALISNLKRCRVSPAIVLRLDSKILAEEIPNTAQLVLVDAPCSGQSLIAKGGKAPGCFHPVTINSNANRQKRILANSAQVVAPQGYLAYTTCTYSPEENEQVADWFLERFPQFQAIKVPHLLSYQSHLTTLPCYRMFPQQGLGAGAFTVLFQNQEEADAENIPEDFFDRHSLIKL
ncbi:RsmB/NOP family class I SAM-dependent RNA methyltransferase [Leptolyngbya sp. FACHB-36]|uniref:RsmB/NOP family class I SAM-dependent RNA methyltransferase n=1 Tax=Leptolyngbya sp. FACHB-36 TaxID=2692808 RepID=UPI0016817E4C|nr:RsmB/NOP family class I SAM-dependent RNA methyltransferase [Leptolyngbya sp. FACHB-36]MBD2022523.1 RsmB/NOP family class I SAM-dependent RNA methyltransferase [Leptolyngbya sp. FACHB-36]